MKELYSGELGQILSRGIVGWGCRGPHFFQRGDASPHCFTKIHVKRRHTVSADGIIRPPGTCLCV